MEEKLVWQQPGAEQGGIHLAEGRETERWRGLAGAGALIPITK